MNSFQIILHGFSYGYLPEMNSYMKLFAIILNYSLILSYLIRYKISRKCVEKTLLIITSTCVAYHFDSSIVGTSTVWCFMYGYNENRKKLDHFIFFSTFGWILLFYIYGGIAWPWDQKYFVICNMAHALSALFGFRAGMIDRGIPLKFKEVSLERSNTSLMTSEMTTGWANKIMAHPPIDIHIINGELARFGAKKNGHSIVKKCENNMMPISKLEVGDKYRNIWLCYRQDKRCKLFDLENFLHFQTIERLAHHHYRLTDKFLWHYNKPKEKHSTAEFISSIHSDNKISCQLDSYRIDMRGLGYVPRKLAEREMHRDLPEKSKTLLQSFFDHVPDLPR